MSKEKNLTEQSRAEQLSLRVRAAGVNLATKMEWIPIYHNLPKEIKLELKKEIEELNKTLSK
jgi:hypothetical protein